MKTNSKLTINWRGQILAVVVCLGLAISFASWTYFTLLSIGERVQVLESKKYIEAEF